MTSEKQVEANRKNAKKSTGPKTVEGKLCASRNALKHGFCARHPTLLPGEDAKEFEKCKRDAYNAYDVTTRLEGRYAEEVACLQWSLMRFRNMEAGIIREGMHRAMLEERRKREAYERALQAVAEGADPESIALPPEELPERKPGWEIEAWEGGFQGGEQYSTMIEMPREELPGCEPLDSIAGPMWLAARGFLDEKTSQGLDRLQRYQASIQKNLNQAHARIIEHKRFLDKRELKVEQPRWYYEKDRRTRWSEEINEFHKQYIEEREEALEYREAFKAAKESGEFNENLEEEDHMHHINVVVDKHVQRIRAEKAAADHQEPVFTDGDWEVEIYRYEA